jgi:hypothetical protein
LDARPCCDGHQTPELTGRASLVMWFDPTKPHQCQAVAMKLLKIGFYILLTVVIGLIYMIFSESAKDCRDRGGFYLRSISGYECVIK